MCLYKNETHVANYYTFKLKETNLCWPQQNNSWLALSRNPVAISADFSAVQRPGFFYMIRPCIIRPSRFDHNHLILTRSTCTWWYGKWRTVARSWKRTAKLFHNKREAKPALCINKGWQSKRCRYDLFSTRRRALRVWKGAIRGSAVELVFLAVANVIADKM